MRKSLIKIYSQYNCIVVDFNQIVFEILLIKFWNSFCNPSVFEITSSDNVIKEFTGNSLMCWIKLKVQKMYETHKCFVYRGELLKDVFVIKIYYNIYKVGSISWWKTTG